MAGRAAMIAFHLAHLLLPGLVLMLVASGP